MLWVFESPLLQILSNDVRNANMIINDRIRNMMSGIWERYMLNAKDDSGSTIIVLGI